MAGGREIKTKIKSVQNTRKVTRALEMVSASKIRKAQERMKASRPYARLMTPADRPHRQGQLRIHASVHGRARRHQARRLHHRVDRPRPVRRPELATCSARMLVEMREWQDKGVEVDVVCIGQKAAAFFRRLKVNMLGSVTHLGDKPQRRAAGRRDQGDAGRLQRRHARPRVPVLQRLRQHHDPEADAATSCCRCRRPRRCSRQHDWDYLYEPDAASRARPRADALHRVAGVPGGAGEPGLRARRAHGRDEVRVRQRQQADRNAAT